MKWDGVLALAPVAGGRVALTSRNDIDMSVAYPELRAGEQVADTQLLLDGEIVQLRRPGPTPFRTAPETNAFQQRGRRETTGQQRAGYSADLLYPAPGRQLTAPAALHGASPPTARPRAFRARLGGDQGVGDQSGLASKAGFSCSIIFQPVDYRIGPR